MREIVIVSAVRTAIGKFGGALSPLSAVQMGSAVIQEAICRAKIKNSDVDEVVMGNVLQAGLGQNPARQAAIHAGLPVTVPAYTVNKVCGSGLKAVALAAQSILTGDNEVVVAGGMESMTGAPYVMNGARWGCRMGDATLSDVMIRDGIWDSFNDCHMGATAENVAEKYGITRDMQDTAAYESHRKAVAAIQNKLFEEEILPLSIESKKQAYVFKMDEGPRPDTSLEKLAALKPSFKKPDGTVTAGNASGINDGAAALVLMSADKAEKIGVTPLARVIAHASGGVDPAFMGTGPIPAVQNVLKKAAIPLEDIDLIEANEAFASQFLAVGKVLDFDMTKVNVNGGAIALGHPIGASGARILVTLLYALKHRSARRGLATLCIGGGMGIAMLVERI